MLLGKKLRFILSVRSDYHMTDSLLIADLAYWCHFQSMTLCSRGRWICPLVSKSYRLGWRCLLFDFDWSTCTLFCPHWHGGLYHLCLVQAMQLGFGLGGCICQQRYIICVVRLRNSLCGLSSASCLFQCKAIFVH